MIAAAVGALLSQIMVSALEYGEINSMLACFIAASAAAVYSEIMARRFKAPVNMYLIIGIIPLVPGGTTYYAMISLISGDGVVALDRALEAFGSAGAIAMGIFAVSSAVRLTTDIFNEIKTAHASKNVKSRK